MIPMVQIMPSDPVRLARTVPLSMFPVHVRDQLERRRKGIERALRRLEDLREEMIDKLDALTIDADVEPSLGMQEEYAFLTKHAGRHASSRFDGASDDREADGKGMSGVNGDSDYEPSLGAPEATSTHTVIKFGQSKLRRQRIRVVTELGLDQRRWNRGRGDHDDEPSLAIADGARSGIDDRLRVSPQLNHLVQDEDLEDQCDDGEHTESDLEPDADGEPECEDEGAQCEDEGSYRDGDDEPDAPGDVPTYPNAHDQRTPWPGGGVDGVDGYAGVVA